MLSRGSFPLSPSDLDAVLEPFERALWLPSLAYTDAAVFAHERAALFDRAWRCVGREEDVAAPGQWLRAPLSPEGVVVVRGADLALRAFWNVCRHRASTLVDADAGRCQAFRCPYHGWTYELTGHLRDAPHAPVDLDADEHGLVPLRIECWQGFVFVCVDDGAPGLTAYVGEAPPWLAGAPLPLARRLHASRYDVKANWKLLAENFQESDHFTRVHPALERLTPNERASSVLGEGNWLGGTMDFAPGVETVSTSGTRSGRPFLASPGFRDKVYDAMLFPLLLTSLQPDYLLTYRLDPLEPARTRVTAETFVHPAALAPSLDHADVIGFWDAVNAEDRAICERQQVGVASRGFRRGRYSTVEDGVHAFDRKVARSYPR